MKKIIISLAFLFFIFTLSGCTDELKNQLGSLSGEKPKYECQIGIVSDSKNCKNFGMNFHMCQIYDPTYAPSQGVPEFCTNFCLNRSKLEDSVPIECIEVSVGHSNFAKPDLTTQERRINSIGAIRFEYEDVEDDLNQEKIGECKNVKNFSCPKNCSEKNDYDCCIDSGKCWANNACSDCGKGECQFPSDCKTFCEENNLWKQTCSLESKLCERTTSIDCSKQTENFLDYKIKNTCNPKFKNCKMDVTKLTKIRSELHDSYNEDTYSMEKAQSLMLKFDDYCIKSKASFVSSFIVESAILLGSLPTSVVKGFSLATEKAIETGINKLGSEDNPIMTKSEFLIWSCQMHNTLENEVDTKNESRKEKFSIMEKIDLKIKELS